MLSICCTPGNPHDGHTLVETIKQVSILAVRRSGGHAGRHGEGEQMPQGTVNDGVQDRCADQSSQIH